jgi:hypothetical protein
MDKKTSQPQKLVFFQSDDAESLFKLPDPALEASDSSSSVPSDFSPFGPPFSGSYLNSPILDKRELARDRSPPPMTQIALMPFQISAKIRKRSRGNQSGKDKGEGDCSGYPPKGQKTVNKVNDSFENSKIVDRFEKGKIHFSNGRRVTPDTTALCSNSFGVSDQVRNPFSLDMSLPDFKSGEDDNQEESPVVALNKLNSIHKLLCAFFNGENCQPIVEELTEDLEFQILGILFTHLKLSFKVSQQMTVKQKLNQLLQSQPKRPRKKGKMVQLIFSQTMKILTHRFNTNHSDVQTRDFYKHYFGRFGDDGNDLRKEFDLHSNCRNRNLPYAFIAKCFKSEVFKADFLHSLEEDYLLFYDALRRQRMSSMLTKWEQLVANGKSPQVAVESIKGEVAGRKFRMAWTNKELEAYFGFFQEVAKSSRQI